MNELIYKSKPDVDGYIEAYIDTPKGVKYLYCKEDNLENAMNAIEEVAMEEEQLPILE